MESSFRVVVLARIYSDSPSLLEGLFFDPPCGSGFSKSWEPIYRLFILKSRGYCGLSLIALMEPAMIGLMEPLGSG
jgi:hypothetical protein